MYARKIVAMIHRGDPRAQRAIAVLNARIARGDVQAQEIIDDVRAMTTVKQEVQQAAKASSDSESGARGFGGRGFRPAPPMRGGWRHHGFHPHGPYGGWGGVPVYGLGGGAAMMDPGALDAMEADSGPSDDGSSDGSSDDAGRGWIPWRGWGNWKAWATRPRAHDASYTGNRGFDYAGRGGGFHGGGFHPHHHHRHHYGMNQQQQDDGDDDSGRWNFAHGGYDGFWGKFRGFIGGHRHHYGGFWSRLLHPFHKHAPSVVPMPPIVSGFGRWGRWNNQDMRKHEWRTRGWHDGFHHDGDRPQPPMMNRPAPPIMNRPAPPYVNRPAPPVL
jgi:hypothetical protein